MWVGESKRGDFKVAEVSLNMLQHSCRFSLHCRWKNSSLAYNILGVFGDIVNVFVLKFLSEEKCSG